MRAKILKRHGRSTEALDILRAAPIFEEIPQFPALAREAAYLKCTLLADQGESVAPQLLALIPNDFQTMDDHCHFVGKSDLLDRIDLGRRAGAKAPQM